MLSTISIFLAFLIYSSDARITGDRMCTYFNGTEYTYSPNAVSCSNLISDAACSILYPAPVASQGYPRAGSNVERPLACYTTETATPAATVNDMRLAAIRNCPKTCGLCCLTDAYSCKDAVFPRLKCNTVTQDLCESPIWRAILIADCPATCGFCNTNECVDLNADCANDPAICTAIGLQDFVMVNCRKTCGFCGCNGCVDLIPECRNDPGICTSPGMADFVKQYCRKTCKFC